MGPKLANNILTAIQKSKKTSLERLIYALGILHVGEHIAKLLAKAKKKNSCLKFPTLDDLSSASIEELKDVNGIGKEIASSIVKFFHQSQNQKVIQKLKDLGVEYPVQAEHPQVKDRKWEGRTFVFTGALKTLSREEAESKVETLGGRVSSSVSKKTDFVVVGEEPGSKYEKAKELRVKILSEEEFVEMLNSSVG
jgi:DNA ligase (NAD+)